VHAIELAVAVGVELGLHPQLLTDPLARVGELRYDLRLPVDEDGSDLVGRCRGREDADEGAARQRSHSDHRRERRFAPSFQLRHRNPSCGLAGHPGPTLCEP
jgi:hypothetical protein